MKKTVFILDDHPLVADGFAKIINSTDHFSVYKQHECRISFLSIEFASAYL